MFWWSQTGSNRRPPECKSGALPTELWPRNNISDNWPWWAWEDLNFRPHAYQACALTSWATGPIRLSPKTLTKEIRRQRSPHFILLSKYRFEIVSNQSLERRWSSRRFPYGYLVTTSPQSSTRAWTSASLRLAQRLLPLSTPMVWRAVCTRPGNVFTAACWSAITRDSYFIESSCRL